MQRNFEPMRKLAEAWQRSELTDVTAKEVIYEAFVEGKLEAPKRSPAPCMTSTSSRSMRSSVHGQSGDSPNAFTSAFKELEPVPQFKATAKLGEFLETRFSQSFQHAGRYRPGRPLSKQESHRIRSPRGSVCSVPVEFDHDGLERETTVLVALTPVGQLVATATNLGCQTDPPQDLA
jgi:hypothetical protein